MIHNLLMSPLLLDILFIGACWVVGSLAVVAVLFLIQAIFRRE